MADPHALVLDGLQRLIETEYRVVGSVADGESLVSEARRLRPDLIVSEIRLPVLGGLEAARRVLAERPGTRVVFLTTVEDPVIAAQAFALGAAGYLLKSSTSEQFLDGLRAVLAGRRVLSPRLGGGDPDALPARGGPGDRRPRLGPRAREVVRLLALGHSMKEAASVLGIATRTVAYHKYGAMATLGLGSSAELVRFAVGAGLVEPRVSRAAAGASRRERGVSGMTLSARVVATPPSRRELVLALVGWAEAVRRAPGLVQASVSEDVEVEAAFELRAEWATEEALEAHLRSDVFGVLVGAAEVLSLSVRMSVARVADEYGLDVIKKRREARWAAAQRREEA